MASPMNQSTSPDSCWSRRAVGRQGGSAETGTPAPMTVVCSRSRMPGRASAISSTKAIRNPMAIVVELAGSSPPRPAGRRPGRPRQEHLGGSERGRVCPHLGRERGKEEQEQDEEGGRAADRVAEHAHGPGLDDPIQPVNSTVRQRFSGQLDRLSQGDEGRYDEEQQRSLGGEGPPQVGAVDPQEAQRSRRRRSPGREPRSRAVRRVGQRSPRASRPADPRAVRREQGDRDHEGYDGWPPLGEGVEGVRSRWHVEIRYVPRLPELSGWPCGCS